MTTKRTHGPCTCKPHEEDDARDATGIVRAHLADCPSLYPAQQEADALTRLVRYIRESTLHNVEKEQALAIISEAREEQRRAKFNQEEVERLRDGVTRSCETISQWRKRTEDAEAEVRLLRARLRAYEAPE